MLLFNCFITFFLKNEIHFKFLKLKYMKVQNMYGIKYSHVLNSVPILNTS